MNTHIITEVFEDKGYMKVTCKEGHYITNWNKENVMEFTSAKVMYCPLNIDLSSYYCITETEYNELMEAQREEYNKRKE